jgi:hypothetical protein
MPKVKRVKSPFEEVRYAIEVRSKILHMKPEQVGKRIGVCKATMYNRLNEPGKLTLGELRKIAMVLDIPFSDLLEVAKSG